MVQRDPASSGAHERARLLGETGDVGGGQFDVVEHRRPRHVRQLMRADRGLARRLGPHPQRRRRLAARQCGHADVEAGVGQYRPDLRHQLPSLLLTQHDLTASEATGPLERRVETFESHEVALELPSLVAGVHERDLDRGDLFPLARREHRQMPCVSRVGGIELHDQRSVRARGDRGGPAVERVGEFGGHTGGNVERRTVESGQERLGRRRDGLRLVGRSGDVDALGRFATDDVHDLAQHGSRHRRSVDGRRQRRDGTGHGITHDAEAFGIDQRRVPRHTEDRFGLAASSRARTTECRNHRAAGGEVDRPCRDDRQPARRRTDLLLGWIGRQREEPAEHIARVRLERDRLLAVREGDR